MRRFSCDNVAKLVVDNGAAFGFQIAMSRFLGNPEPNPEEQAIQSDAIKQEVICKIIDFAQFFVSLLTTFAIKLLVPILPAWYLILLSSSKQVIQELVLSKYLVFAGLAQVLHALHSGDPLDVAGTQVTPTVNSLPS